MSPLIQFVGSIVCFILILAVMVFLTIVLQDGTFIVPLTALACVVVFLLYKCIVRKSRVDDEDGEIARPKSSPPSQSRKKSTVSLASGWEEYADEESGVPFYYCEETGETTWERP